MSGQSPEAVVFWRCLFGALAMLVACLVLGGLRRSVISARPFILVCLGGVARVLDGVLLAFAGLMSALLYSAILVDWVAVRQKCAWFWCHGLS
ncbi:hypothetical protein [Pseudomonas grimontii]|uniref:hypothetical protein n=1 Tax=Pseudomonas grimontii TaxID=129847 RepID=UPI002167E034|nr:hypothetical protein [Pseudomonas grimontii]MCS3514122.1 hypothetical protein [Pseudomonas grimontii]